MCSTVQVLQHHFPIQIEYYVYFSRSALAAYRIPHLNSSLRHDGSAGDAVLTFVDHVHPACNKKNDQNISDSRSQKLFVWSSKLFLWRGLGIRFQFFAFFLDFEFSFLWISNQNLVRLANSVLFCLADMVNKLRTTAIDFVTDNVQIS